MCLDGTHTGCHAYNNLVRAVRSMDTTTWSRWSFVCALRKKLVCFICLVSVSVEKRVNIMAARLVYYNKSNKNSQAHDDPATGWRCRKQRH